MEVTVILQRFCFMLQCLPCTCHTWECREHIATLKTDSNRAQELEVDVLYSPSLIVLVVSVDVKLH